jgi:glycosyltransferase involved in cell wall biosynthesis
VLIVTNLYPDARQPAFGTFVAEHAEALRRAGAEVAVVAIAGVPAHRARVRKYLSLTMRAIGVAVLSRLRRTRPQVVEAHVAYPTAFVALVAARIAGASLVVYCHGSDVTGLALRSRTHHAVARWLLARADLVVANSAFIRDLLEERYQVPATRLTILPPGIDLRRFTGPEIERNPHEILYVGRLSAQKGIYELVRAAAGVADGEVTLRFVGDGPERAGLEQAATSAGIRAEFSGPLPHPDVAGVMRQAAVIAMPSTYPEGLGLVAIEAMAAGAMTVGTAAGAIGETIEDGETGWLVPPGDVAALAGALTEALSVASAVDPTRRDAVRRRAMAKAREHDIDAIATRTLRAYESAVRH